MKTRHVTAALAALLLIGVGIQADDDDGKSQEFEARLTGSEEVPPVVTNTSGKAEIVFNKDETKADYELTVRKGVRVTQSHIHCAPKGVNGPVVVFLAGFHNRGWDVDGSWIENATVTDANVIPPAPGPCPHVIENLRDLAAAIRAGDTYVNVHTVANPGGEVRGQLRGEDDDDDRRR
jgi:CHRD domain-containing protein